MELIEERQQIGLADLATKRDIGDLRKEIEDVRKDTRIPGMTSRRSDWRPSWSLKKSGQV